MPKGLAQAGGMQIHSYRSMSLAFEHWERPPPIPCPLSRLCPFGGYRRRQNLYRWFGERVRAGDRVPNFVLPAGGPLARGRRLLQAPMGKHRSFLPPGVYMRRRRRRCR